MNTIKYNNVVLIDSFDFLFIKNTKRSLYKTISFETFKLLIILLLVFNLPNKNYMIFFILALLIGLVFTIYNIYKAILKFNTQYILKLIKNNNYIYIDKTKYSTCDLEKLIIFENTSNVEFDIISLHIKTTKKTHQIVEMSGYKDDTLNSLAKHLNYLLQIPIEKKNI